MEDSYVQKNTALKIVRVYVPEHLHILIIHFSWLRVFVYRGLLIVISVRLDDDNVIVTF